MTDTPHSQDQSGDEFGLNAVREVLRLISETDVTEIQIERGETKLHIKRGQAAQQAPFVITPSLAAHVNPQPTPLPPMPGLQHQSSAVEAASSTAPASAEFDLAPGSHIIVSPMVGTFYASPSPKDSAFVRQGDTVQAGDVVGIVEAMKIMNEIDSEFSGRIARILVANGQPVEYGQSLMIVEPV
jgi:acetyl-CoA carboxylase biotin carboxyl carrier protein